MFTSEDNYANCRIEKERAMSKEREDFEAHILSHPCAHPNDLRRTDGGAYECSKLGLVWNGWQACAAHYQPLLDAKDAEIARLKALAEEYGKGRTKAAKQANEWFEENTALKALLEQAREVLAIIRDGARNQTAFSGMSWQQIEKIAVDTLAAINAATNNNQQTKGE